MPAIQPSEPAERPWSLASLRSVIAPAERLVSSPGRVAAVIVVVYGAWTVAALALHHSPYFFVGPGRHYVNAAAKKGLVLPAFPSRFGGGAANRSANGSDGQFTFYLAVHPETAKSLVDVPWYRYQRILEPLVVRVLSLGKAGLMAWTMTAVSLASVLGGTWALAVWLDRHGRAPLWALAYGLWPGLIGTVNHDLTDGFAYGLVAVSLVLVDSQRGARQILGALAMAAAVFARQETALFAAMFALGIWLGVLGRGGGAEDPQRSRSLRAVLFASLSVVPYLVYLGFLSAWLGKVPSPISSPQSIPLPEKIADLAMVIVPAIVVLAGFLPAKLSRWRSAEVWGWSTYALNVAALTGFMVVGRVGVYYSWAFSTVYRYYIPAALAALVCYGFSQSPSSRRAASVAVCCGLSMLALPVLMATGL